MAGGRGGRGGGGAQKCAMCWMHVTLACLEAVESIDCNVFRLCPGTRSGQTPAHPVAPTHPHTPFNPPPPHPPPTHTLNRPLDGAKAFAFVCIIECTEWDRQMQTLGVNRALEC